MPGTVPGAASALAAHDDDWTAVLLERRASEALGAADSDREAEAAPEDIDLCMILGAGWPFHLGGITPYLDRTGITEKVTGTPFRI